MRVYVQFGGFADCPAGWRNFEPSIYLRLARVPFFGALIARWLPHQFPETVEVGDIVKGLPIEDGQVDVVFCSHVLEHLAYEDFLFAIRNVHKLLRPGGVFRLVVPDLEGRAKYYLENMANLPNPATWLMTSTLLGVIPRRKRTVQACVKALVSSTEHRWMWDYKTLAHELLATGFSAVRRIEYGESNDPVIRAAEKESRFFWSPGNVTDVMGSQREHQYPELAVEATK